MENILAYHVRAEKFIAPNNIDRDKPVPTFIQSNDQHQNKEKTMEYRYDVVICRALSSLEHFLRLAIPLMAVNGKIVALKGDISEHEIASAREYLDTSCAAGGTLKNVYSIEVKQYSLPFIHSKRCLISVSCSCQK